MSDDLSGDMLAPSWPNLVSFFFLTDEDLKSLHRIFLSNVITGKVRDTVGFFSLLSSSVASLNGCRIIDISSRIRAWSESKNSPTVLCY